jgi:hypothetical protein
MPMSMRVRKLAMMLLVLVLPWQAVTAASMPASLHHHASIAIEADAATPHDGHAHPAYHQHADHNGSTLAQDDESGSADTAHGTSTDISCAAALVADATLAVAAAGRHELTIPFATHRLPSPAPDLLERPPRNALD